MQSRIDLLLRRQPCYRIFLLSMILILVLGYIDGITGYELSFSIFYLLPISLVAWYTKAPLSAISVCVISAVTWLYLDLAAGHQYSNAAYPFWNTLFRLGSFLIVAVLLRRLRKSIDIQSVLAQIDGLTGLMNSRTFHTRCQEVFHNAVRYNHPLALGPWLSGS
jgi:hypothetical protein